MIDISKKIIELREMKGYSTNKLANMAGISQSYLREIELGNKNPTVEILSYICDALDITISGFFSESSEGISPFLFSALCLLNKNEQELLAQFIVELRKTKNC